MQIDAEVPSVSGASLACVGSCATASSDTRRPDDTAASGIPSTFPRPAEARTLLVNNIPKRYNQESLMADLERAGFGEDSLDFVYLPMDFNWRKNRGYAFVNCLNVDVAEAFARAFHGNNLTRCGAASKVVAVSVAAIQGLRRPIDCRLQGSQVFKAPSAVSVSSSKCSMVSSSPQSTGVRPTPGHSPRSAFSSVSDTASSVSQTALTPARALFAAGTSSLKRALSAGSLPEPKALKPNATQSLTASAVAQLAGDFSKPKG